MARTTSLRPWVPPLAALAGGLFVLVLGCTTLLVLSFVKFDGEEVAFGLMRDLALALSVAGIVALLFEVHHHITHQMRTTREVIDAIMGEKITPEVWDEVKLLIERRQIIRRDMRIRLSLDYPCNGLREHEAILGVEQHYDVYGLTDRDVIVAIEHELDYQFHNEALDLPRFEYVEINPPGPDLYQYSRQTLKQKYPKFSQSVSVKPRDDHATHVHVQRFEIVHVPGSYNLYSPEFTKGHQLYVGEWPEGIGFEAWVRPFGEPMDIKKGEKTFSCECLLLPGQGIEIKFILKKSAKETGSQTRDVVRVPDEVPAEPT